MDLCLVVDCVKWYRSA